MPSGDAAPPSSIVQRTSLTAGQRDGLALETTKSTPAARASAAVRLVAAIAAGMATMLADRRRLASRSRQAFVAIRFSQARNVGRPLEGLSFPPRPQERFLHSVFGVLERAEHPTAVNVQLACGAPPAS